MISGGASRINCCRHAEAAGNMCRIFGQKLHSVEILRDFFIYKLLFSLTKISNYDT